MLELGYTMQRCVLSAHREHWPDLLCLQKETRQPEVMQLMGFIFIGC